MIGAIAGDIIGSVYEGNNIKTKEFPLFSRVSHFTDDTVLTVALADSILNNIPYVNKLKEYYQAFPWAGYGGNFRRWATSDNNQPYNSWGNGSAMRVSPIGFAYNDLATVLERAKQSAEVTHNHPEGIKGAQATAAAIFLARTGKDKATLKDYLENTFGYDLSTPLDEIRPTYRFDVSCQGSVPQAIIAFLESENFEDAIRNAISIGGDSDTIACITGGMAQAFYGEVPEVIQKKVWKILPKPLRKITEQFSEKYLRSHKKPSFFEKLTGTKAHSDAPNIPNQRHEAALGAFLGACVGDAAGAILEFSPNMAEFPEEVEKALALTESPVFHTARGQITDDSELALCLAQGLVESNGFNIETIAGWYAKWIKSRPFDIGYATRSSLGARAVRGEPLSTTMMIAALDSNSASQANGSLMRCVPLGIWGWKLAPEELGQLAHKDSALSHPHPNCRDSVACYVIAIASLIKNGDRQKAIDEAYQWASAHNPEVKKWMDMALRGEAADFHPHVGWVKIGFTHAFKHLAKGSSFLPAIREVLTGGGDTDTNACIVGGLIGAANGVADIPEQMKTSVLGCDTSQGRHKRPSFLRAYQVPDLVKKLL